MFTFTMKATDLRDLLAGCIVAMGKDPITPVLCAVQVTVGSGAVTARATDRYTAVRGEAIANTDGQGSVLVPAELVTRIVKSGPKLTRLNGDHRVVVKCGDAGTVSVRWSDGTVVAGESMTGSTFPELDKLFPAEGAPGSVGRFGFDPARLAALAKIPRADKHSGIWFRFMDERRPAVVTVAHDSIVWSVLLMPYRPGSG